jgi:hypothetical protein
MRNEDVCRHHRRLHGNSRSNAARCRHDGMPDMEYPVRALHGKRQPQEYNLQLSPALLRHSARPILQRAAHIVSNRKDISFPMTWPPWPNGQGVGLLIRRLRVRVPQGVIIWEFSAYCAGVGMFALRPDCEDECVAP